MSNFKNISNMTQVFDKLNDLKMLLAYGQKLIPIIKSLVDFMHETVPLLENINNSISDTTSKMPNATNQINNVTNATELATTEILDIVDSISNDISKLEGGFKKVSGNPDKKALEIFAEIKALLGDSPRATELIAEYESLAVNYGSIDEVLNVFSKIKMDAYNITLSLQVQDITSQQLAAVTHLIESVNSRLSALIIDIDDTNLDDMSTGMEAPVGATFDPNASYDKSAERQERVDEIINKENEQTTQSEIDKLFS